MFDELENKILSFLTHGYQIRHRKLPECEYSIQRIQTKVSRNSASETRTLSSFRLQATLSLYVSFLLVNVVGLFILIGEEPDSLGEYLMYRLPSTIMGIQFLVSQLLLRTMVLAYVPTFDSSKTLAGWLLVSCRASIISSVLFIFVTLFTVTYMSITQIWLAQYGYWFLMHFLILVVVLISPRSKTAKDSLERTNKLLDAMSLKRLMGNEHGHKTNMVVHDKEMLASSPFAQRAEQQKQPSHSQKTQQGEGKETPLLLPPPPPSLAAPLSLSSNGGGHEKGPEGGKGGKSSLRATLGLPAHNIGNHKPNNGSSRTLGGHKTVSKF